MYIHIQGKNVCLPEATKQGNEDTFLLRTEGAPVDRNPWLVHGESIFRDLHHGLQNPCLRVRMQQFPVAPNLIAKMIS